jgi:hypothetical protein
MRQLLVALALCAWTSRAAANGRMPGANDLAFSQALPDRIVARATFGIVESDDRGASWRWICEQAIDISGVIADPPLGLLHDGTEVLLPPTGSALVSHNAGCTWTRAGEPLAARRGADLTIDPGDPMHLLVLTSTLRSVDGSGIGSYENLLLETRDDARSWQLLATLPDNFEAETVEVAPADARRIYVSGVDAAQSREGILLRSDDGAHSWTTSRLSLPAGSGSLWISGIHPTDPDRLWVRVSARGDSLGLLPARLLGSGDKGATFQPVAATNKGMFGFALSPDGAQLAYGGPSDGLYVGPSSGSGAFSKRSDMGIMCLRWPAAGALYACASEPRDPFSVGVSSDDGVSFRPLFRLADTCPAACASGTSFAQSCQSAWSTTLTLLTTSAGAPMCTLPWSPAELVDASAPVDASVTPPLATLDASSHPLDAGSAQRPVSGGCRCAPELGAGAPPLLVMLVMLARSRRRQRSKR